MMMLKGNFYYAIVQDTVAGYTPGEDLTTVRRTTSVAQLFATDEAKEGNEIGDVSQDETNYFTMRLAKLNVAEVEKDRQMVIIIHLKCIVINRTNTQHHYRLDLKPQNSPNLFVYIRLLK